MTAVLLPRPALLAAGLLEGRILATVLALTDIGDMIRRRGASRESHRA